MRALEVAWMQTGAWHAFDAVLAWINTQTTQKIDKKDLYKEVMRLRPRELDAIQNHQKNPKKKD